MSLWAAVAVWFVVSIGATAFIAAMLRGARRVEHVAVTAPHAPAGLAALVALGITLPGPRTAADVEVLTSA